MTSRRARVSPRGRLPIDAAGGPGAEVKPWAVFSHGLRRSTSCWGERREGATGGRGRAQGLHHSAPDAITLSTQRRPARLGGGSATGGTPWRRVRGRARDHEPGGADATVARRLGAQSPHFEHVAAAAPGGGAARFHVTASEAPANAGRKGRKGARSGRRGASVAGRTIVARVLCRRAARPRPAWRAGGARAGGACGASGGRECGGRECGGRECGGRECGGRAAHGRRGRGASAAGGGRGWARAGRAPGRRSARRLLFLNVDCSRRPLAARSSRKVVR
jgi:hypothetical protein